MEQTPKNSSGKKTAKILGKSFRLFDFVVRDDKIKHDDEDDDGGCNDETASSSASSRSSNPGREVAAKTFAIQMFGINERGETCSITVNDFKPFFYVKGGDKWGDAAASAVLRVLRTKCKKQADAILSAEVVHHQKLYGFTGGRTFPFIKITFGTMMAMNQVKRLWYSGQQRRPLIVHDVPLELYESNIPPLLRFFHIHNISPSGWIF